MEFKTLYARSTTGKISEWKVEVEGNKFRTISGFSDGLKVTSNWVECEGKSYNTSEEQALKQAKALHKKKVESGMFENIKDIDNETFFEPMLAKKLEDRIDKLKFPVYSNVKLDGVRCIVKSNGMWTREGKELLSAPHIFEDLKPLFEKHPDLILDGEMYCDKLANDFNKIISLVRKKKPTAEELAESKNTIQYHVYDLPSCKENYYKRYLELVKLGLPKSCVIVHPVKVNNVKEIRELYERYMEQGYEGQIIRLDAPYENKRSNSLLKDKKFVDAEFEILGVEQGKGNMSGKVGKLNFKINGKPFDAAVNGDWEYLERLLKAKDLIGKQATVKYFNLTPDGIPRFGKVIAIRDYE